MTRVLRIGFAHEEPGAIPTSVFILVLTGALVTPTGTLAGSPTPLAIITGHPPSALTLLGNNTSVSDSNYSSSSNASQGFAGALSQPPPPVPPSATYENWPTYQQNSQRTGNNVNERTLGPSNASQLSEIWSVKTPHNGVFGSPTVVNGTVFVGDWHGNETAVNASNGAQSWTTDFGLGAKANTSLTHCAYGPNKVAGITDTATVWNNTLFVATGNNLLFAYNLTSRQVVPGWPVNMSGDTNNNVSNYWTHYYPWGSPLVYNGFVYIGTASGCDSPLVQGQLLQVRIWDHRLVHTFNVTSTGGGGGSIWSTPSVDRSTNTVWISTGNENDSSNYSSAYTRALVALNASDVSQVKGYWQEGRPNADDDFGAGPTLFSSSGGGSFVGATNKDGTFYAFSRTNVTGNGSWNPLWRLQTSLPGTGAIAPAAVNGTALFLGSTTTPYGPLTYSYSGLPSGCTSANSSAIACTPTAAGSTTVKATLTNVDGHSISVNSSLTVEPSGYAGVTISSFSVVPSQFVISGALVSFSVSAANGSGSYNFSYSGMPGGSCTNGSHPATYACNAIGTGAYNIVVNVTSSGHSAIAELTLLIGYVPTPAVWSLSLRDPIIRLGGSVGISVNASNLVPGSVRAVVPATGATIWQHESPGGVEAGLAYANGIVVDGADWQNGSGATLEVLRASTGAVLWEYNFTGGYQVFGAPSISDGRIFVGTAVLYGVDPGYVYEFGIPLAATSSSIRVHTSSSSGPSVRAFGNATGGMPTYNVTWNWGDGAVGYGSNQNHTFVCLPCSGRHNYTISLSITDATRKQANITWLVETNFFRCGSGYGFCWTVLVIVCNQPLVSQCFTGTVIHPGGFAGYVGGASGGITWNWNFGDGTYSTSQYPLHTYAQHGTYTVSVTATDSERHQATVQFEVWV